MVHSVFERRDEAPLRHWQGPKGPAHASAISRPPEREDDDKKLDSDLLPLFVLAWIASMVRVAGAVVSAETFGTEPTLALLFVLGLPWLFKDAWRGA